MTTSHRYRRAFTLIELLIVIAIIGLLVGLIIPAVSRVRESANRMTCANNLKQIGLALVNISTTTGSFPGVINDTTQTSPPIQQSWVPFLLPFLDQENLGRRYNLQETPLSTNNRPLIATVLPVLACPSVDTTHLWTTGTGNTYAVTDYSPCVRVALTLRGTTFVEGWNGTEFGPMEFQDTKLPSRPPVSRKLSTIIDGVSKTLLVTEMAASPELWRAKRRISATGGGQHGWAFVNQGTEFDSSTPPDGLTRPGACAMNCQNIDEIYGFHPGGVNAVFCDGHVGFIDDSISVRVMAALVTREGREKFSEEY